MLCSLLEKKKRRASRRAETMATTIASTRQNAAWRCVCAALNVVLICILCVSRVSASPPESSSWGLPSRSSFRGLYGDRCDDRLYGSDKSRRNAIAASATLSSFPSYTSSIKETIQSATLNHVPFSESLHKHAAEAPVSQATSGATVYSPWRDAMPELLRNKGPNTFQRVQWSRGRNSPRMQIYILGTAHVSNNSCHDVQALLETINPDVILVELCEARMTLLDPPLQEQESSGEKIESVQSFWEKVKEVQASQGGSRWQAMTTVLLTQAQESYADELDVELGGEFRVAHDYWLERNKELQWQASRDPYRHSSRPPLPCTLILGDRPLSITLWRAWESLPNAWVKTKIMGALLWSFLFHKPNKEEIHAWLAKVMAAESDVLTESLQSLKKQFPTLYTTIIAERDAWMAAKLIQICQTLSDYSPPLSHYQPLSQPPTLTIVAIVGAGHVPGIVQWLTQPPDPKVSPEDLLRRLAQTRKYAHDPFVQQECMPQWVKEVTQVQTREESSEH
jgi:pheromone shutdown protein TraB